MAVIKSLTPRSVSTGCLLHLSLIWLLALIWASRSLTGIQSSSCTRSVGAAASSDSTSALCARNLGRKRSPTKSACEQTPLLPAHSAFFSLSSLLLPRCLIPSLPPSALSDKVQRLKSAARNSTCLCK